MSEKLDERSVRKIFSEVVAGFSLAKFHSAFVFVKHFSPIDSLEFDFRFDEVLKDAKTRGIPTEEEKIGMLIEGGLWSKEKEDDINRLRDTIISLQENKRNHYAPRDIESFNIQIKEHETAYLDLINQRGAMIGNSAESLARRKVDMAQIFNSFYHTADMDKRIFTEEEIEGLENEDIDELLFSYNTIMMSLGENNMRKVAVSADFQMMYGLTDNLYEFYGCPIAKLTNYQLRLASYGNHFRHILGGSQRPPQSIIDDPDKLEDWFYARTNVQKLLESSEEEGKNVGIFGVTKKDLEFWGIDTGVTPKKSIGKAAREAGGMITGEEMMNQGLI